MSEKNSENVPVAMQTIYEGIVFLTDSFCRQRLNDEYATLCHKLAAALARKRPSPLMRGKLEIWACGIVYAIGAVNFLFDKSQKPHMGSDELCKAFGVGQSSGASKSKQIRDLLGMYQLDPKWCLPSRMDDNPMVWMLEVNGLLVDTRHMPREVQEIAYRKGLIPYIPADRQNR